MRGHGIPRWVLREDIRLCVRVKQWSDRPTPVPRRGSHSDCRRGRSGVLLGGDGSRTLVVLGSVLEMIYRDAG